MDNKMISIVQDFSDTPAGRYIKDGPFSGEKFRKEHLLPALKNEQKVSVDLQGALGFGSSFLEEAFGGLVRDGLSVDILRQRLNVITSLKIHSDRIWQYIEDAALHRKSN